MADEAGAAEGLDLSKVTPTILDAIRNPVGMFDTDGDGLPDDVDPCPDYAGQPFGRRDPLCWVGKAKQWGQISKYIDTDKGPGGGWKDQACLPAVAFPIHDTFSSPARDGVVILGIGLLPARRPWPRSTRS